MRRSHGQDALRWTVIGLAFAGVWVSGTLLMRQDGGWKPDQDGTTCATASCASQTAAGCSTTSANRWSSFDVSIGTRRIVVPTAFLGLAYFLGLGLCLAITGRLVDSALWMWRGLLLAVTSGLAGSVFLLGVMGLAMPAWCPMCIAAHLISVLIFVGVVLLRRTARRAGNREIRPTAGDTARIASLRRRLVTSAFGVIVLLIGALWLYYDAASAARRQWRKAYAAQHVIETLKNDEGFVRREYYAQPIRVIPCRDSIGVDEPPPPTQAKPTLVVFTDYSRSACACFASRRRAMIERAFGDGLLVDVRHYPGDLDDTATACFAAEAARLQGEDAFARMRKRLFTHGFDVAHADYIALARAAGLNVERFRKDFRGDEVRRRVREDMALGAKLGVSTTPTVFLSGRKVPDLCLQSPVFWQTVAADLAPRAILASGPNDARRAKMRKRGK